MALPVQVTDTRDIIYWGDVFRVLGIKRCRPLFGIAGVPAVMVNAPENLMSAAQYFWGKRLQDDRKLERHASPPFSTQREVDNHLEAHRLGILGLLSDTFTMIVNAYGEAAAYELYDWAQRNFVDHDQVVRWNVWNELFLRLIDKSGTSYPLSPSSLAPSVLERIKKTVREYSSRLLWEEDNHELELMAEARKIPLSSFEQRMVALDIVEPDDEPQADVLLVLELVLRQQATYEVWIKLDSWLNESDRKSLLQWGREQAVLMNKKIEWVTLPDRLM